MLHIPPPPPGGMRFVPTASTGGGGGISKTTSFHLDNSHGGRNNHTHKASPSGMYGNGRSDSEESSASSSSSGGSDISGASSGLAGTLAYNGGGGAQRMGASGGAHFGGGGRSAGSFRGNQNESTSAHSHNHHHHQKGILQNNHRSPSGINTNRHASFIDSGGGTSPSGGGGMNASSSHDVHALRTKISELEYQLSKYQHNTADSSQDKEAMDTIRLERDVANRNCQILTSNVDTLKALSVEMATQLDQAVTRCNTLEERLKCNDLKKEVMQLEGNDQLRKSYEERLHKLEKSLKEATATNEGITKRFAQREVEHDERIRTLETSKDATILKLMKENDKLKELLATGGGGNHNNGGIPAVGGAAAARPSPPSQHPSTSSKAARAVLQQFRSDRLSMTNLGGGAAAGNNAALSVRHRDPAAATTTPPNTRRVLNLSVESRNLVAIDNNFFTDEYERRHDAVRGVYPPEPSYNVPKYHVDMQVDVGQLVAIPSEEFRALKDAQRQREQRYQQWYKREGDVVDYGGGADAATHSSGSGAAAQEWCFVTDRQNAIRIVMETL